MSPPARMNTVRLVFLGALVYAVDDPGSLAEVRRLRDEILEQRGGKSAPIVGSKADLSALEGRVLPAADVMATVEGQWDADFMEASARTGGNTVGVFRALLQQVKLTERLSPAVWRRGERESAKTSAPKRSPQKKNSGCILS